MHAHVSWHAHTYSHTNTNERIWGFYWQSKGNKTEENENKKDYRFIALAHQHFGFGSFFSGGLIGNWPLISLSCQLHTDTHLLASLEVEYRKSFVQKLIELFFTYISLIALFFPFPPSSSSSFCSVCRFVWNGCNYCFIGHFLATPLVHFLKSKSVPELYKKRDGTISHCPVVKAPFCICLATSVRIALRNYSIYIVLLQFGLFSNEIFTGLWLCLGLLAKSLHCTNKTPNLWLTWCGPTFCPTHAYHGRYISVSFSIIHNFRMV